MSRTTIQAVWIGDRHEDIEELHNGHGSAPVVWGKMFARYVGVIPGSRYPESEYMFRINELWPLWKRQDIPQQLRAVLTMTYDHIYIKRKNYKRAAADIRAFLAAFDFDARYVNHWPRIAEFLESDPGYPAIAFWWTSVCCDPLQGPYNEEADDYDPFDWSILSELYEQLDAEDAIAQALPAQTGED